MLFVYLRSAPRTVSILGLLIANNTNVKVLVLSIQNYSNYSVQGNHFKTVTIGMVMTVLKTHVVRDSKYMKLGFWRILTA